MLVGFVINPIAGMGGRVGLKGTDGVLEEAIRRGAEPVSPSRAAITLKSLVLFDIGLKQHISWLTCSKSMGEDALRHAGFTDIQIVHETSDAPCAADTQSAALEFLERGCDLILFCGGDGTARDIIGIVGKRIPVIGIPSGVKMYSGVFGYSAEHTARLVRAFISGECETADTDVVDLDEQKYRAGEWSVRLYYLARSPYEPNLTQEAKALIVSRSDEAVKAEIASYLADVIADHPKVLYLLGPGSTVAAVAKEMGIDKTLLGIDAIANGKLVGADINEQSILDLLDTYRTAHLILSPIGAQGFVLGRGNLQISPRIARRIGIKNMTIIATPAKLRRTPILRFSTGDDKLDAMYRNQNYAQVVIGNARRRLVPIA